MKGNITTDFEDFKDKQEKKFDKTHEYQPLSNDIEIIRKLDNGEYEKTNGDINIIQVTGVVTDEEEIKKIENQLDERVSSAPVFNTDLQVKKIKRGDTIWVTALLEKPNSTSWNAQSMGVIKCRVVDYYYGLNKLKYIN
jgi:hypothetical protein